MSKRYIPRNKTRRKVVAKAGSRPTPAETKAFAKLVKIASKRGKA